MKADSSWPWWPRTWTSRRHSKVGETHAKAEPVLREHQSNTRRGAGGLADHCESTALGPPVQPMLRFCQMVRPSSLGMHDGVKEANETDLLTLRGSCEAVLGRSQDEPRRVRRNLDPPTAGAGLLPRGCQYPHVLRLPMKTRDFASNPPQWCTERILTITTIGSF